MAWRRQVEMCGKSSSECGDVSVDWSGLIRLGGSRLTRDKTVCGWTAVEAVLVCLNAIRMRLRATSERELSGAEPQPGNGSVTRYLVELCVRER